MYQPKRNSLKSKYKVDYGRSKKRESVTIISFLICLFGAGFFSSSSISGQNLSNKHDYPIRQDNHSEDRVPFRVMSWNVENLFDTHHDSLKNDEEFLPEALRHWNYTRYKKKLDDIARVIVAVGEWNPPALVGLCEVENDTVLRDLTRRSPLKNLDYRYVMTSSPDQRGIDVALLYQRDLFKLLSYRSISIPSFKQHRPTRDLLHVSGLLLTGDTLDVFVCHLPSRSGGAKESEPYRLFAAQKLRAEADSLLKVRFHPQLIIMGDFNDYPTNKSIKKILEAEAPPATSEVSPLKLYHLLARKAKSRDFGSYKYRGEWGLLDHLIVSGTLLDATKNFFTNEEKANVFQSSFLLIDDEKYGDKEPFRTYKGMRYQGGFSDHLPIFTDFELIYD
ncbi:endonuclease/exonuclease/phosphatase family protein [uncultured Bacteroides sp.]|uniref:endonuclease/exonuclease/phosphatase family protein n=1 Tax=uncultured Bacteroides sp. TaxID=162156 RepID=UPI0025ED8C6B|nr:endonuclease/exonuclease/phosphatase family protein [uncultured Bacteroides sp.]